MVNCYVVILCIDEDENRCPQFVFEHELVAISHLINYVHQGYDAKIKIVYE